MAEIRRIALFAPSAYLAYMNMLFPMKRAFEARGVECVVAWPHLEKNDLATFLDEARPDAVLEINRSRRQAKGMDDRVLHIAWMQDHRVGERLLRDGFGDSDIAYFIVDPVHMGFDISRIGARKADFLLPAVDIELFRPNGRCEPGQDFAFVGYLPPKDWFEGDSRKFKNADKVVTFGDMVEEFRASALRQRSTDFDDIERFVLATLQRRLGLPRPVDPTKINGEYRLILDTEILRMIDRCEMLESALKVSRSLAIYGPSYWKTWEEFQPYYRGIARRPQEIMEILGSSRIYLHNGVLSMHFRNMECFACGGAAMINRTGYDSRPGGIYQHFEPGRHYIEYDYESFEETAREALDDGDRRARIGAEARRVVEAAHTWQHRVDQILADLRRL